MEYNIERTNINFLKSSDADQIPIRDLFPPISKTIADQYLETQRDPMVGTQTKRVEFSVESTGYKMSSSLPISIDFPFRAEDLDIRWEKFFESQGTSLWAFSLGYLPTLFEVSNDFLLIEEILKSAWKFTGSPTWREESAKMASLDHCLACRIRALATLKMHYDLHNRPVPHALLLLVINDVLNLVTQPDESFPLNNHGAMTAIALLHFSGVFPCLESEIENSCGIDVPGLGLSRLESITESIFDKFGIANENSPEYQQYWISLLTPVQELFSLFVDLQILKSTEAGEKFGMIVQKAKRCLEYFVDYSGHLLPIGDSHPRKFKGQAQTEIDLISEESGFALYKHGGVTFSFNCGSTNYAHKHCDDSSITLSVGDTRVFLDSAFYSHEWDIEEAIYVKSQNAHSGLFLTGLDGLHPGKLYWPGEERVSASMTKTSDEVFSALGRVCIDSEVELLREVRIHSDRKIEILDKAVGETKKYGQLIRRFIIPATTDLSCYGNQCLLTLDGYKVRLVFGGMGPVERFSIACGVRSPQMKGWFSPELYQLERAICLEVPTVVGNVATTMVEIEERAG